MTFNSLPFLLFFAIVLAATALLERFAGNRARVCFLLAASYVFYAFCDWRFCFLLLSISVFAYYAAKHAERKPIYLLGILAPLLILGVFKYFNFFIVSFASLLHTEVRTLQIVLPAGISFYTFQAISYVTDVRRGKLAAEKDFITAALYLSFFPHLLSGPIVRAGDLLPQLHADRKISADTLSGGMQMFAFGLFKKMVLADNLALFVNDVYRVPTAFHWGTLLLAAISYSLQIYFDFSGYSDMAIGCAKCLGYDYRRNFDLPYIAQNVTEFWHRWHISLSTWLKDYLYIPLGGNRKGKLRTYINLFLAMLLGGLWHGADWTFVFWGALNGAALCLDKLLPKREKETLPGRVVSIVGTFLFITVTLVFFRADSFNEAKQILGGIVSLQSGIVKVFPWSIAALLLLALATLCAVHRAKRTGCAEVESYYPLQDLTTMKGLTVFFLFLGVTIALAFTGEQPFVYFQF